MERRPRRKAKTTDEAPIQEGFFDFEAAHPRDAGGGERAASALRMTPKNRAETSSAPTRNKSTAKNQIPNLMIGTSAFTAEGWAGAFYPKDMAARDYLSFYAERFPTVELDSTFYRTPSAGVVKGWYAKTPAEFIFAAKVPRVITHEKVLVDCEAEWRQYLGTMELLGEKLGPILFQFGYFNQSAFRGAGDLWIGWFPS